MQPEKTQKLQQLINTSAILDAREKQEWLALLELMDDKQAAELEKILSENIKSQTAKPPPLTHLMNLPKDLNASFQAPKEPVKKIVDKVTAEQLIKQIQDSEVKKERQTAGLQPLPSNPLPEITPFIAAREAERKTGFWQKIKDILAEKELPAGHPFPTKELELPVSTRFDSGVDPRRTSASLGGLARVEQKIKLEVPKPKQVASSKNQVSSIKNQEAGIRDEGIRSTSSGQAGNREPDFANATTGRQGAKIDTVLSQKKVLQQPPAEKLPSLKLENLFKPGVKLDEVRPGIKSGESFPPIKKQAPPAISMSARQKEAFGAISLQDLAKLGLDNFAKSDPDSLAKKIKPLVKLHGYHNVIFSLEKSPLFKAYINTGIKVLGSQTGFGQGYGGQTSDILKQEDFEKFTDLLMGLQT